MPRYIDIATWARRDTFEFFRGYDKPYFNVGTSLDVTNLVAEIKQRPGFSLSLAYHYFALRVVNEIEPFRYRLREDQVLVHDVIHGGTTLLLPNETFIMAYFDRERHHAMMDGITVGRYLDRLQDVLLEPADYMSNARAAEP